ncbi:MAG: hypothetical protein LBE98_01920 [Puniceicoccales bacterium]|jgi:chromosome segregation ATPase|nr:hypothetical protein [Puniceicoccales bacterium]
MNPTASSAALDPNQGLPQSESSDPTLSIRPAEGGLHTSRINQLKGIVNTASKALRLFGVDARFFPKFVQNLKGAVIPACIAAVSCFVALHFFSTIGVCFIGGTVFFLNLAVSRARLEIMKEDLEAAKQAEANIASGTQQLGTQNAELLRLNQEQKTTLDEQKATIEEAQQNLQTAQSKLSAAQESLAHEQQIKELQEKQSEEQAQLIAQQEAQLQAQEAYIAQCQSCLTSVFASQQSLIHNLEQRLQEQTATVQEILQNVQTIAKGEQKLTDALSWAQGQISAAQAKLTAVIDISADMTDPAKCKQLIESGEFEQKAQEMQRAAQEAYNIMNELNSGLTTRILEAQSAIAASRQQAEAQLRTLTSQQQETSHTLEQANTQIRQKEQEIARLDAEHQTALANIEAIDTERIQTLTAEIEREKQSLTALTQEKGSLAENLQTVQAQCTELQGKVHSLASSNEALQTQCRLQEQTLGEQQRTIDSQRSNLAELREVHDRLQTQIQSASWWRTAASFAGGMVAGAVFRR